MKVTYIFDTEIKDGADPDAVGNMIFEFLADVPEEIMPELQVVSGYDYKVER